MKYKAIITDLDGTAVDSPRLRVVSERLRAATAVLESRGIKVCAATGRAELYAMPALQSMELRNPAIISGGARIIDPASGEELWRCGLSADQMHAVIDCLQGKTYSAIWNDYTEDDYLLGAWNTADYDEYDATYFFGLSFIPVDEAAELIERLRAVEGVAVVLLVSQREGLRDIHVTNAAATKEHAVYALERIIGVDKADMIGIGDAHNDLHLFNAVGHKVAMGNAVPELKTAADEVIGTISEDGLAIYFEQLAKEANE